MRHHGQGGPHEQPARRGRAGGQQGVHDQLHDDTAVLATTTATAPPRVVEDVEAVLGLGQSEGDVLVLRGPLDRESLHLSVVGLRAPAERMAWLSERRGRLFEPFAVNACLRLFREGRIEQMW